MSLGGTKDFSNGASVSKSLPTAARVPRRREFLAGIGSSE